jgi:hypothetical protein
MKLSRLLKCLNYDCVLNIRTTNDWAELNCSAGEVPFWLTQRQILSTDVSKGKLSVVVSEE